MCQSIGTRGAVRSRNKVIPSGKKAWYVTPSKGLHTTSSPRRLGTQSSRHALLSETGMALTGDMTDTSAVPGLLPHLVV